MKVTASKILAKIYNSIVLSTRQGGFSICVTIEGELCYTKLIIKQGLLLGGDKQGKCCSKNQRKKAYLRRISTGKRKMLPKVKKGACGGRDGDMPRMP